LVLVCMKTDTTVLEFVMREWGKSFKIVDSSAEKQTGHLRNTRPTCYLYDNLIGQRGLILAFQTMQKC
jgi:hypothetical protein